MERQVNYSQAPIRAEVYEIERLEESARQLATPDRVLTQPERDLGLIARVACARR